MDSDFWASKVHTAKHHSAVYAARLHSDNYIVLDDSEGEDDSRTCFPCPFCYVDVEVTMLCIHLQEEHCFDLINAVCPLCAANLGKDVIGHFTVQHASSLKRRKSQKSGFWPGSSALLGKELSRNGRANTYDTAPDPLLSSFICSISYADPLSLQQEELLSNDVTVTSDVKCTEPSSHCDKDKEERRRRAAFVQQLMGSTIF